ncbi:hypothetical protein PTKIN_Ptkin12aG0090800 [Pterospermum kingtungense]
MENGKRAEAGSSVGVSVEEQEREPREMTEKPLAIEVHHDYEEVDEMMMMIRKMVLELWLVLVPGPLVSLKEQIEKDKSF